MDLTFFQQKIGKRSDRVEYTKFYSSNIETQQAEKMLSCPNYSHINKPLFIFFLNIIIF